MQTNAIAVPDATDTSIKGSPVSPDYGRGATFNTPGVALYDNRALANMFNTIFESADRYRMGFDSEWLKAYAQYHGAVDEAGKAPWQSLVHAPFSSRDVNTIAARIVAIMFSEEDWFDIEPDAEFQDMLVEVAKKVTFAQFHKGHFREPTETSIKDALICGNGPLKITYERAMKPWMSAAYMPNPPQTLFGKTITTGGKYEMRRAMKAISRLRFEPVIPTDFWLDPSGQNRFVIQRVKRHISDLWKMARPQPNPGGTEQFPPIYDPEEVAKVRPGARNRRLDQAASTIRRERPHSYDDTTVDIYEFWGDFYDPSNGVTIFPNIVATFADTQWCLRKPSENPFWHQSPPYVLMRPILNPHQIYGYGFLMQGAKLQDEMDRMLQVMVDKVHMGVPMVEVDKSAASNAEDFGGDHLKIWPARMFNKKSGDRKIFTPVELNVAVSEWEVQVYRLLQEAFTLTTGVNEFVSGQQMSTNRKTKAEVDVRVSASQQNFNDVGQYMEEHSLSPLVAMVYFLSVQFEKTFSTPRIQKMFQNDPKAMQFLGALSAMPLPERWDAMDLDANFRVTGITLQVTRQQRLDRVMNFLKALSGDPQMAMLVNKRTLLRDLLQYFALPSTLVLPQSEAILQAFEVAMLAQFQQPPGAGGQPGQGQQPPGENPNNQQEAARADMQQGAQQDQEQGGAPQ